MRDVSNHQGQEKKILTFKGQRKEFDKDFKWWGKKNFFSNNQRKYPNHRSGLCFTKQLMSYPNLLNDCTIKTVFMSSQDHPQNLISTRINIPKFLFQKVLFSKIHKHRKLNNNYKNGCCLVAKLYLTFFVTHGLQSARFFCP